MNAATTKTKKTKPGKKAKAASKAKAPRKAPSPASDKAPRDGTKLAKVVELLKRPEGCTTKDVLTATGWPTVSMPQQAKAAGLTLQKEKDGAVTRYRAA